MGKSIYKIGECDYCGEENNILRPTPFLADAGAGSMMCEYCWGNTRKEYAASNGEYIGKFDECEGYHEVKEKLITNESLKGILESIIECSDQDTPIEKYALARIEELEKAIDGFNCVIEGKDKVIQSLYSQNRELVEVAKDYIEDMKDEIYDCSQDVQDALTNKISEVRKLLEKVEGVE